MGSYGNMGMVTMLVIGAKVELQKVPSVCVCVCTCDLPIESLSSEIVVVW